VYILYICILLFIGHNGDVSAESHIRFHFVAQPILRFSNPR